MDYTPTGWVARYADGSVQPVVAWVDDAAMVVNTAHASLRKARDVTGFKQLEETERVAAAFPAYPGWRLRFWDKDDDDSTAFEVPIVGWLVNDHGQLTPVGWSQDSFLEGPGRQRSEILAPAQELG